MNGFSGPSRAQKVFGTFKKRAPGLTLSTKSGNKKTDGCKAHNRTLPYSMTSLFPKRSISNVVAVFSKMAEAAVESQSDKFYCHECNREVSLNFPVCIKTQLLI